MRLQPSSETDTGFNRDTQTYQGELLGKTGHVKAFLDQKARVAGYDYSRIEAVLDLLIQTCTGMKIGDFSEGSSES